MPDIKNVFIVGAGPIGCLLATFFSRRGCTVDMLLKPQKIEWFKVYDLLTVQWPDDHTHRWESHRIRFRSTIQSYDFSKPFLLVIATKSFDAESAMQVFAAGKHTYPAAVLLPTNGLEVEGHASNLFPDKIPLISMSITYPCELDVTDRRIVHLAKIDGGLAVAPATDSSASRLWTEAVAILLRGNGLIDVRVHDNWRAMKFTKLILNVLGNAIPAILDLPLAEAYAQPEMRRLELLMIDEILHIMKQAELKLVDLPGYVVKKLRLLFYLAGMEGCFDGRGGSTRLPSLGYQQVVLPRLLTGRGGNKPSLQRAMEAQTPRFENYHAQALTGTRISPNHFPANRVLSTALQERFGQTVGSDRYRHNPEYLWQQYLAARTNRH